jgi:hypothetical protein
MPGLRPSDVLVLRELEKEAESRGLSKLSTRQLSELSGVARKTVTRSLGRLASEGLIVKSRKAHGNYPAQWQVPVPDSRGKRTAVAERMTPRDASRSGTPDLFRRRDLQGPGAIYDDLPDAGTFTAEQALARTDLTSNVRTVERWLLVLASQRWPMTEEFRADDGPSVWAKIHLEDSQLSENAEHVNNTADVLGQRQLKTRQKVIGEYQRERFTATVRSAVPYGY